jgi:hypothetical protein
MITPLRLLLMILGSTLAGVVTRVMLAAGVGYVLFDGVGGVYDDLVAIVAANLGGLPAGWAILEMAGVRSAFAVIVSAIGTRFLLAGVSFVTGALLVRVLRPAVEEVP